VWRFGKE